MIAEEIRERIKKDEADMLPVGWRTVELSEVAEKPEYGFTDSASSQGNAQFLRITDITDLGVQWKNVPFCNCPPDRLNKFLLRNDDIVFARIGATTGKSYIIKNPPIAVYASYLIRVRTKEGIAPDFLYYFFQSQDYWRQIDSVKGMALKGGVNSSILSQLKITLPPLPEQRAIARVLSTLQAAITKQDELIQTTQALKKALMHKLFTEGLNEEPTKETEIGPVPESWKLIKISEVAKIRGGKRVPKGEKLSDKTTLYPYIRVTDFDEYNVNQNNIKYLNETLQKTISRYIIEKNDVYVSIAGSIGIVGMIPENLHGANLTENAARLVINDLSAVVPRYLMYYLNTHQGQNQMQSLSNKNAQPKLAIVRLGSVTCPLPAIDIQNQIVKSLDSLLSKLTFHRDRKQTLESVFRTLLHELMTGQRRVSFKSIL